jgi:two-component system alkaline phosphatase synthesis response regulator PhoP
VTDTPLILVIDDEIDLAVTLQYRLEKAGYEVVLAHEGKAGLKVARARRPDLILLDLGLPDLSGFKVCRKLRRDERTARARILMVSARIEERARTKGLKAGADGYLLKPFSTRDLLGRVARLLEAGPRPEAEPGVPTAAPTSP